MRGGWWGLKVRKFVDDWLVVVVIALLLVAGAGAFLSYDAYTNPETITEERVVDSWSDRGSFTYAATVEEPNEVFSVGEELSGQPTYYSAISPNVDGEFRYDYTASSDGRMDVQTDVELILRSADEDAVYWSIVEPIESAEGSNVDPNEPVTTPFSINVSRLDARLDAIEESLGASPGTSETLLRATVTYSGRVNDESVSGTRTYDFVVVPEGATYQVEDPGTVINEDQTTVTETTVLDPDPRQVYGFGGLSALALLAAVGLLTGRYYGHIAPSESAIKRARWERERDEFDDWISNGTLPATFENRPRIEMASLEDIVDVAIDCDRRVIETTDRATYYVIDGDLLYVFEPDVPADPEDPLGAGVQSAEPASQPDPDEPTSTANGGFETAEEVDSEAFEPPKSDEPDSSEP